VKKVYKKKSVDFSALTEGNTTHRSPVDIVKSLTQHFTERHSIPSLNMANPLDKEADEVWKLFSLADSNDIELISSQSDLQFKDQDIKNTIRSLKNRNSSGFDQVSNKMVKLLPAHYHELLTRAYNVLFCNAFWGNEWKRARTICLKLRQVVVALFCTRNRTGSFFLRPGPNRTRSGTPEPEPGPDGYTRTGSGRYL
jgi:hypothetical protein